MPCRTAAALPLPASSEGGVEGEREEEEEVTKSAGDLDKAASPSSSSCNHTEVKSVVIIGNGPSGISLSFMLSGNAPYYLGGASDEFLHKRLSANPGKTILQQDLEELATGCEGRSSNPVSVFFDLLNHPDADTGQEKPSLLEWRARTDLRVDHVVLGKGRPGGCWDSLEGDVQTVSLGSWMELPNLKLGEVGTCRANCRSTNRVNVSHVAKYYREYVERLGLAGNFVNEAVVTSVREVKDLDCLGKEGEEEEVGEEAKTKSLGAPQIRIVHSTPNFKDDDNEHTRNRHESEASSSSSSSSSACSTICSEENAMFKNDCLFLGEESNSSNGSSGDVCSCSSPSVEDEDEEEGYSSTSSGRPFSATASDSSFSSGGAAMVPSSSSSSGSSGNGVVAPAPASHRRRNSLGNLGAQLQLRQYQRHYGLYSQVHLFDESSARDGQMEELASDAALFPATWDAIVNPQLFCGVLGGCRTRTSSWSVSSCAGAAANGGARSAASTQSRCPVSQCFPGSEKLFEVRGYRAEAAGGDGGGKAETKEFRYLAKNVVLATGSYDLPNRVRLPGEDLDFVVHSLAELEDRLRTRASDDPVVVVGAGLSAADAVVMLRGAKVKIRHAFRRSVDDPSMIFKVLPKTLYPEYQEVYRLMCEDKRDPRYLPLPEHNLVQILPSRVAVFEGRSGGGAAARTSVRLSVLAILIGSSPDLRFLEPKLRDNLGVVKGGGGGAGKRMAVPLGRNNPVDIDLFTNEAVDTPGIYAMGPLVGDNFVRFLLGGALAITRDIIKKERKEEGEKETTEP